MSKKKTNQNAMTPEQYYRWRLSAEQMNHAETKAKLVQTIHNSMDKELEIAKLKHNLHREVVKAKYSEFDLAKKQYQEELANLEQTLGTSIKGKVIDEYTFEIKDIDETK